MQGMCKRSILVDATVGVVEEVTVGKDGHARGAKVRLVSCKG